MKPFEALQRSVKIKFKLIFILICLKMHQAGSVEVGLSQMFYLLQWKPFKNEENCILFHLKNSFRSWDEKFFVLTFWSCRKNGLTRKIRLISKFQASKHGWQKIAIHIFPKISWSKGNLAVKYGQLIKYTKINIFLRKSCRK